MSVRREPTPVKPLVLTSGRANPFEVLLLVACTFTGVFGLVAPGSGSRTIDQFIPHPWTVVFYAALFVSAALALAGVFLRMPLALLIERVGMAVLSSLLLVYGLAVYALHGLSVGVAGAIILSFGVAAVLRVVQISRDLAALRVALRHSAKSSDPLLADPEQRGRDERQ